MIFPSLTITLFPYTTLFRSEQVGVAKAHAALLLGRVLMLDHLDDPPVGPGDDSPVSAGIRRPEAEHHRSGRRIDRKSTRLNSSHGYISYAVFCLKKKNSMHI